MANNNSKQRLVAIAAVIIVLLLGVNAFLLINNMKQKSTITQQTNEIDESEKLKVELEKQYYEALSELEEMRGSNEELNDLIEQQKAEVEEQKDRISKLIRNGKDLKRVRTEMKNMTAQVEQYVNEINQLKTQNEQLSNQNYQLAEEKSVLETTLVESQTMNQALEGDKENLLTEKEKLEIERAQLSKKVGIASVIKVEDVVVTGFKSRKNGKVVSKKYAKNIDHLKVCFNTSINNVVEAGSEQFFVRLINPLGETLAIEELGSGVLTNSVNGEQIRYTQMKKAEYNSDEKTLCMIWQPNVPFSKGNYDVEVYNKGYKSGDGNFSLK